MLSLTRKTEYALIALWQLARAGGAVLSARDIAEQQDVPLSLLMNLLKDLNRKGFVRSVRGASGGYQLARAPQQVSLRALIEAIEGPVRLMRCAEPGDDEPACCLTDSCPIRTPVGRVHERLVQFLDDVSLNELMSDGQFTELRMPVATAKV